MTTAEQDLLRSRIADTEQKLSHLADEFSEIDLSIDAAQNPEDSMIARLLAAKLSEAAFAAAAYSSAPTR